MQRQREAMKQVLECELAVVRGLRIGPDLDKADAAVVRERILQAEIDRLEAEENVVPDDEEPLAINFSKQRKQPTNPEEGR